MMKRTMKAGWLVVAAALMMGMTACSNDDNMTEEPTVPHGVQVTVSAGLDNGDGNTTRADVDYDATAKTRTLKFTTGDRLYIWRYISGNLLIGILTMDDEPTDDGLGATFSGTLKAYDGYGHEITDYNYTSLGSDPLTSSTAILIPSGAAAGCFNEANHLGVPFVEEYSLAADVNTLMKTALYVAGTYNDGSGYTLTKQYPILNCAIGTLSPNTDYTVKLRFAPDKIRYEDHSGIDEYIYTPTVRTDGMGNVRFAISGTNHKLITNKYWVLQLLGGGQTKDYVIGQKQFAATVYNLTREINSSFPYQQAGSEDYISTTFGYNESTWSQQTGFGLLKFKYTLSTSPGQGIVLAPIRTVTINDGDGHTYTVTDTRDDGMGGTLGFDTNFQFYVGIWPVSGKTLTITYDPHNNQFTYVGTVESFSIAGGNVLDLGTVELVKTTN